jgi:hypothetical protein
MSTRSSRTAALAVVLRSELPQVGAHGHVYGIPAVWRSREDAGQAAHGRVLSSRAAATLEAAGDRGLRGLDAQGWSL